MVLQVVVLAAGTSKNLVPLVSKEVPKALLPVANRPVISWVLEHLEQNNLKDLIVVEGEDAALHVGGWISGAYVDRLHVEVATVPEDVGTAGAIRAIAHHLTAEDILVVSGDLVSHVPLGAVVASPPRHGAVVTAVLCSAPVSGALESGSGGGKDKIKKPGPYNIIGLDTTKQFLLYIATGDEIEKDTRIQKTIQRAIGQMEIRSDLMDAYMCIQEVGPHCMLGEGSQMGDKCSVKRSVIGRHCRMGSNVKIVNSVVKNHVTIADGCSIQGSVSCSNVQLQERVSLKDCQVGAGFVVSAGCECKAESLARKEK